MLNWLKKLFGSTANEEPWQDTLQRLANELVPPAGEAQTLQGELVRCINNLADEAERNGWMNYDEGDEESVEVLERYLPDAEIFNESLRRQITSALEKIRYAGERGADRGEFAYDEIAFIARHVAIWCNRKEELLFKNPEATWLDEDPFGSPNA